MYRCHDIEIPRLYIADITELEDGTIDPAVEPGFECFLSPYLDTDAFNMRKVVATLVQRGCAQLTTPIGVIKDIEAAKPVNNASFAREFVHSYPLKQVAEKTVGAMAHDLVFVCENVSADEGSIAELFGWVYGEHHPYRSEVIEEQTRAFSTPLGSVTVKGPDGPAPFRVTKLLNRHYAHGETRTVNAVDELYELSIDLDDLTDNEEYRVGCEGRQLAFRGSDERTECFTCVAEGLAFGIGVYDPSDDWDKLPHYDPSQFMGYFVDATGYREPVDSPICITPVPLQRDKVTRAILWVGWLENWDEPREPWQSAEELLDFFLT